MPEPRRCADCGRAISAHAQRCPSCAARRRQTLTPEARQRGAFTSERASAAARLRIERDRENAEIVKALRAQGSLP